MEELKVKVWKLNRFSYMPVEQSAVFGSVELAKQFIDCQASIGNHYGIVENGKVVYGGDEE